MDRLRPHADSESTWDGFPLGVLRAAIEQGVDGGQDQQGQERRRQKTADHGQRHRAPQLTSFSHAGFL